MSRDPVLSLLGKVEGSWKEMGVLLQREGVTPMEALAAFFALGKEHACSAIAKQLAHIVAMGYRTMQLHVDLKAPLYDQLHGRDIVESPQEESGNRTLILKSMTDLGYGDQPVTHEHMKNANDGIAFGIYTANAILREQPVVPEIADTPWGITIYFPRVIFKNVMRRLFLTIKKDRCDGGSWYPRFVPVDGRGHEPSRSFLPVGIKRPIFTVPHS